MMIKRLMFVPIVLALAVGCGDDNDNDNDNNAGDGDTGDGDTGDGDTGDGDTGDGDTGDGDTGDGDTGDGDTGDGDTGGDGDTNVDDGAVAEDLSEAEATAFCESLASSIGDDIDLTDEQFCELFSAAQSADAEECASNLELCLMGVEEPPPEEEPTESDCEMAHEEFVGCQATVGEIETCFQALAAKISSWSDITCEDAGMVSEEELAQPTECAPVQQKCPNLLGGEDEEVDEETGN